MDEAAQLYFPHILASCWSNGVNKTAELYFSTQIHLILTLWKVVDTGWMRQHSCIFRLNSFDTSAYSQVNLSTQWVNEAAERIFHTNSHFKPTSSTTCRHKEKMNQPSCIFKIHTIPTFKTVSIHKRVQHHYKCIQSTKIRFSATLDILYQNPHTLTKCLLYSIKGRTVSHKSSVETKTAESIFCWKQIH